MDRDIQIPASSDQPVSTNVDRAANRPTGGTRGWTGQLVGGVRQVVPATRYPALDLTSNPTLADAVKVFAKRPLSFEQGDQVGLQQRRYGDARPDRRGGLRATV